MSSRNSFLLFLGSSFFKTDFISSRMIMGVGMNISTLVISDQTSLLGWVVELVNLTNPPLVNSISYGEPEKFLDPATINRMNVEFQKLAGFPFLFQK